MLSGFRRKSSFARCIECGLRLCCSLVSIFVLDGFCPDEPSQRRGAEENAKHHRSDDATCRAAPEFLPEPLLTVCGRTRSAPATSHFFTQWTCLKGERPSRHGESKGPFAGTAANGVYVMPVLTSKWMSDNYDVVDDVIRNHSREGP